MSTGPELEFDEKCAHCLIGEAIRALREAHPDKDRQDILGEVIQVASELICSMAEDDKDMRMLMSICRSKLVLLCREFFPEYQERKKTQGTLQ